MAKVRAKTERQPSNAHCPSWFFSCICFFVLVFAAMVKEGRFFLALLLVFLVFLVFRHGVRAFRLWLDIA